MLSPEQYEKLVQSEAKKSPKAKDCLLAFLVGGGICALGEILQHNYQQLGLTEKDAGTWVTITLILLSAIFTGLNQYHKLAKYAGAGTLVPVTGFANSIVSPAIDYKTEGMISGMAAKMFVIAGPVLVFGITASVIYGILLWLTGLN